MKINIQQLTDKGKRENNEDFLLADDQLGLYMVCDGVGGNNKGEIASETACGSFAKYFKDNVEGIATAQDIDTAVTVVEADLDNYVAGHPESAGMATTLTLLQITKTSVLIAHIGDSRIYHYRDGKMLHKTFDHSLVNELLASGNITEEDAASHPQKNMITRALQGSKQPVLADTKLITDIAVNDFFLMCTDGVLESVSDDYLSQHLVANADNASIIQDIEKICLVNSRDNFSAVLIKIENMSTAVTAVPHAEDLSEQKLREWNVPSRPWVAKTLFALLIIISVAGAAYYYFPHKFKTKDKAGHKPSLDTIRTKITPTAPNTSILHVTQIEIDPEKLKANKISRKQRDSAHKAILADRAKAKSKKGSIKLAKADSLKKVPQEEGEN